MSSRENIENEAYMILQEIAFVFRMIDEENCIVAINLNNTKQKVIFKVRDNDLLFSKSNMSKLNTYKSQLIAERNKIRLIKEMNRRD